MINSTRERTTRIYHVQFVCLFMFYSEQFSSRICIFLVHVFVIKRQQLSKTTQTFQEVKTEDFFDFGTGSWLEGGGGQSNFFFIQTQTSKICIEKYGDVFFFSFRYTIKVVRV